MATKICDVCGSTENVRREVFTESGEVIKVADLCGDHWIEVYRKCIEYFQEHEEFKVANLVRGMVNRVIGDSVSASKLSEIEESVTEEFTIEEALDFDGVFRCKNTLGD